MTRRNFLALAAAASAPAAQADITVGITCDTRPDWNGPENFLRSVHECSDLGFRWIETFWHYVSRWENRPQELVDILADLGLKMETVSNGGAMNTNFERPAERDQVIADHMRLVRFIQALGCDHLKINCGAPIPGGHTAETYRETAKTFDALGRRISDLGIRFGVHAHLWSKFETGEDVRRIFDLTDPDHVYFILDTGHTTMAGMNPVALTKTYGHRIIEYHLKDTAPENRGGYKGPPIERGTVNTGPDDRIFFELGAGGVDFPAILAHLNSIRWKGWFTIELDRTATAAKDSAARSKRYLEKTLGLSA